DKQPPEVLEEARQKAKTKKTHMDKPSSAALAAHVAHLAIDPQQAEVFLRETEKPLATLAANTALAVNTGSYDSDNDLQNYMVQMHAMKTALENVGKMDLSAAAFKLEQAARDRIMELVESETPAFLRAAKAFAETLSQSSESKLANRQISGLDIVKGLERYHGDDKIYIAILRSYAASVGSMLKEIESISAELQTQAVIPQDKLLAYRTKVHGIKGTSLDIFAGQVGREARDLEEAAKSSDFDFIKNNTSAFLDNAGKLVAAIENVLQNIDTENPKPKKDKPDKNILLELLAACKKYHINKVDEAMAEIEKYQYEADDGL
ncbi:MAG: hypothetical protein LBG94_06930, partial [Treponema sp.]|nr:hypothetical protein [Treponema sp.]